MPWTRRWIVFELLLAAPVLLARTSVAQTTPDQPAPAKIVHHKKQKMKPLVLPPLPQGPLHQLPMDQIPSTPAKVSFQGGLLSISAQNSTLGEILREVHQLTGASIDVPAGTGANERVVTHLGPGAPRDVLAGLLNGSSFNYVMVGSNADPGAVTSLVLTAKSSPAGEAQTTANIYQNSNDAAVPPPNRFPQPMPFNQSVMVQPGSAQPAPAADEEDVKDDEENADDNADDQNQAQQQPMQPDVNGAGLQNQQSDPNQPNAGPKTPEQILEMLRRQQQPGASVISNPEGQPPPQ